MTMAASLEARCPMLDVDLVEFMGKISPRMKIPRSRMGSLKHLLRRCAADLIPAELLQRPKHGFNVPLDAWFRESNPFIESVLSPKRVKKRGIFDAGYVDRVIKQHRSGALNVSNRIYALLVFEVWAQEFLS